jgi:DNA-directed RNA polymerase subunit RPC12/RpoP
MGIKFRCQDCDKKLHVKSFLAGKRGICPHCGARVNIPSESQAASEPVVAASHANSRAEGPPAQKKDTPARKPTVKRTADAKNSPSAIKKKAPPTGARTAVAEADDPFSAAPDAVWYVRPPGGGQFGPANSDIMQRWLEEGRVSPDALVWREGWPDWKAAGPVFPTLEAHPVAPVATGEFLPDSPTAARATTDFPVSGDGKLGVATRLKNRSRQGGHGRNVAMIVVLSVACVGLLIALFYVLTSQG